MEKLDLLKKTKDENKITNLNIPSTSKEILTKNLMEKLESLKNSKERETETINIEFEDDLRKKKELKSIIMEKLDANNNNKNNNSST
jgi:hypothetical protein